MEPPKSTKSSPDSALNEAGTAYRAGNSLNLDLEFPDWSGQARPEPTATMDDIHRLSLSLLAQRQLPSDLDQRRLQAKIREEFKL